MPREFAISCKVTFFIVSTDPVTNFNY